MRFNVYYTIQLDDDETPETLAKRCKVMDCPCEDIIDVAGRCPLGSYQVTGLCRFENAGAWRTALQQEKHEADIWRS